MAFGETFMTMMLLKDNEPGKSVPPRKGRPGDAWLRSRALRIRKKGFQHSHEQYDMDYKVNREAEICQK
jgi:hypothetical protein